MKWEARREYRTRYAGIVVAAIGRTWLGSPMDPEMLDIRERELPSTRGRINAPKINVSKI